MYARVRGFGVGVSFYGEIEINGEKGVGSGKGSSGGFVDFFERNQTKCAHRRWIYSVGHFFLFLFLHVFSGLGFALFLQRENRAFLSTPRAHTYIHTNPPALKNWSGHSLSAINYTFHFSHLPLLLPLNPPLITIITLSHLLRHLQLHALRLHLLPQHPLLPVHPVEPAYEDEHE